MNKFKGNPTDLKFTIHNREYIFSYNYITSIEGGLKLGDIRIIGNIVFFVNSIDKSFLRKDRVNWYVQLNEEDNRSEVMDCLRKEIFLR